MEKRKENQMTPDAIKAAILLGAPIPPGVYDLGENCELHVRTNGSRLWFRLGLLKRKKFHREDGPAIEWADGACQWYRDGESLTPLIRREI